MENSIVEIKRELIQWIDSLDDLETLQKILDLKSAEVPLPLFYNENPEDDLKNDFDEQFAAGMTSDELLENIAAHLEKLPAKED